MGILDADRINSTISPSVISCPFFDPADLEILSFISVPPKSFTPIERRLLALSGPNFVHEACTLSIKPFKTIRETACIRSISLSDAPGLTKEGFSRNKGES